MDMVNKKFNWKVCKADLAYHGSRSVLDQPSKRKHIIQMSETSLSLTGRSVEEVYWLQSWKKHAFLLKYRSLLMLFF